MPKQNSNLREFGYAQSQPLHTVTRKIHLRSGVVTHTFQAYDCAFPKLGVKHLHA
jgi:hypothetical protein